MGESPRLPLACLKVGVVDAVIKNWSTHPKCNTFPAQCKSLHHSSAIPIGLKHEDYVLHGLTLEEADEREEEEEDSEEEEEEEQEEEEAPDQVREGLMAYLLKHNVIIC